MHKALGLIPRIVQLGDIVNTCSLNTQWMETDQKLEVSLLCVKPCLRKKKANNRFTKSKSSFKFSHFLSKNMICYTRYNG